MLIWHAIVKDEAQIIGRCLDSVIPHVDGAVVVDTGSTDGTQDVIQRKFELAGKPCQIGFRPFENFAQARNAALALARGSALPWTYALLCDADMELKVEKPDWLNGAGAPSYDMRQVGGGISYYNKRLLSRSAVGEYKGVTHEYLDVGPGQALEGAYFIDHADGANRPGKFERDVALLEAALATETSPGLIARYHFYLGQSYFELGQFELSAGHYKRRIELGGWDEEIWYAQFRYAFCQLSLGNAPAFVFELLQAYEMRPQRLESLYALAKFFREQGGANYRSLLFSKPGLQAKRPDDLLFVSDYVYTTGLRDEFAICAFYDSQQRSQGARVCNDLALNRHGEAYSHEQARNNLFWYLQPLSASVPSFTPTRLAFEPPENWAALNPSVINRGGKPLVLVRTVNYAITADGRYISRTGELVDSVPVIRTRNWLVDLDLSRHVANIDELALPTNFSSEPEFPLVRGFEDSRLFEWHGRVWTLSTVREMNQQGWCEQVLAPLTRWPSGEMAYSDAWWHVMPQMGRQHEKNWMPWPQADGDLRIVYRLGTVIDCNGKLVAKYEPAWALGHVSGGSQAIAVSAELSLALVHEARILPHQSTRYYQHRFVLMRADGDVVGVSPAFFFHDRQIEFAAGLALFGEQLMVSYGVRDEEAWLATMRLDEVLKFCAG